MKTQFPVAVVGGGMVGAAIALGLSALDIEVALIDPGGLNTGTPPKCNDAHSFDPRVSALTLASEKLLRELNVWAEIEPYSLRYTDMDVWDSAGSGRILFSSAEVYESSLGLIVENRVVTSALHQRIAERSNILVIKDQVRALKPEASGYSLDTGSGETVSCRMLVGADGALSRIRQWLSIPTREWDYGQQAIVATITTARPHQFTARQRFLSTGPLALLPLLDQDQNYRCSSIVWSADSVEAARLMQLDDASFKSALSEASEQALGEVLDISRRFAFPLRQRHAKRYFDGGAVLIGDAAHTIHPLAGQGVNLGFEDVTALLDEARRALDRGVPLGHEEMLRRYQRRRQAGNLSMMTLMEAFKRGFGHPSPMIAGVRNAGLTLVNKTPLIKKELIRQAMGV
ncbi:FAD-dependent monooxygenase [Hahella aquimaris]|uniref:FAD-dependent monooxygenase n=1 Tax=Hahella sp. HNIBRBA332 TaxID=3015983 RepID=UPI00273B0433|nr:FAD-dependent monooxygenase [Hahella sp. HNIBRBA332]WLQ12196.1 FAD-dependent monooxygenase [Hahella sp. HNIBRBA332]